MKKTLIFSAFILGAVILFPARAHSQTCNGIIAPSGVCVPTYTVATRPASPIKGQLAYITDGVSATSGCTTGSGSTNVLCVYDGSAWVIASGAGTLTSVTIAGTSNEIGVSGTCTITTTGTCTIGIPALVDLSGKNMKPPTAAGFTPTSTNQLGLDSTLGRLKHWDASGAAARTVLDTADALTPPASGTIMESQGAGVNPIGVGPGTTTTVMHGNAAGAKSFGAVVEADQTLADNTTNNVSTTKHGYAPKAPNDATKFLDGTGAYTTPSGGSSYGTNYQVAGSNLIVVAGQTYWCGVQNMPGAVGTCQGSEGQQVLISPTAGTMGPLCIRNVTAGNSTGTYQLIVMKGTGITGKSATALDITLATDIAANTLTCDTDAVSVSANDYFEFKFINNSGQNMTILISSLRIY